MSETRKTKVLSGDEAVLARRYAAALHEQAVEKKALEAVEADMQLLKDIIDSSREFQEMAVHPRLSPAQTQKVLKSLVEAAKANAVTASFLMTVARNRRLAQLSAIIETFQADMAARRGQHTAYVTVAKPLTSDQNAKLIQQLGAMVGGTVKLIVEQDETLIGGMIVKLKSSLIDASIKGKLARLERQLKMQQEAA